MYRFRWSTWYCSLKYFLIDVAAILKLLSASALGRIERFIMVAVHSFIIHSIHQLLYRGDGIHYNHDDVVLA